MSKRQEKIAANRAKQQEFIAARLSQNLAIFEDNFNVGVELYEANKDTFSEEQKALIEAEMDKNRKLIDEIKRQATKRTEA
jgi:hypothetical protein